MEQYLSWFSNWLKTEMEKNDCIHFSDPWALLQRGKVEPLSYPCTTCKIMQNNDAGWIRHPFSQPWRSGGPIPLHFSSIRSFPRLSNSPLPFSFPSSRVANFRWHMEIAYYFSFSPDYQDQLPRRKSLLWRVDSMVLYPSPNPALPILHSLPSLSIISPEMTTLPAFQVVAAFEAAQPVLFTRNKKILCSPRSLGEGNFCPTTPRLTCW